MSTESVTRQLTGTGLFSAACSVTASNEPQAGPVEAFVNAGGHEMLARLGLEQFRLEVARRAPATSLAAPGWTLGAVAEPPWPSAALRHPHAAPPVLSQLRSGSTHRLLLDIRPELFWFDGHFPGRPILAGVAQLHLAVLLSLRQYDLDGYPLRITRLKFQHVVIPPRILELTLERDAPGPVRFRYRSAGRDHSQGRLHFDRDGQ